ncbi:agamous-like MADS-box protein AGL80 [Raphanus sativus]|uniref:Agamous-like MADS-box protein AGL80 n=1 Tax=Raphanus sativus TaxID=3726 RepID=A0A9W3C7U0_RAPSA|nr:agamous-like MADS-box protein AGL80 [Raphanus sativus]
MTRRKEKHAFIVNNSSRKTTYKKRKRGLLKKAHEIFTLCEIYAGAIIYSPYDPTPEVWPSVEDWTVNNSSRDHNKPALASDLNDLSYLVDQYLNSLNRRIQILEEGSDVEIGESL